MTIIDAFDTYYIVFYHIVSVFILLCVNFTIWLKAKKIPLLYAYLIVQGIIFLWMFTKICKTVAPDITSKWFFVMLQYAGVCFVGEAFLIFAYLYAFKKIPNIKYIVILAIPSFFFFLIIATNPYHMLFYSSFNYIEDNFGPLFYCHQIYNYILILCGIYLCSKNFRKRFGPKRKQSVLFSIAILIPLIANMLYIFRLFEPLFGFRPLFDITPIACNISLMLFAVAAFKYELFDAVTIARRKALALIPEGILLLNSNYKIIDYNNTFEQLYNCEDLLPLNDNSIVFNRSQRKSPLNLYREASFINPGSSPFSITYPTINQHYYKVIRQPLSTSNKILGISFRFIDITLQQKYLSEVTERNKELADTNQRLEEQACIIKNLAIAQTRNFIASEIHDILGHSVMLVLSILEVARFSLNDPSYDLSDCLNQSSKILNTCLKEIQNSILGLSSTQQIKHSLKDKLNLLIEDFQSASVDIELTFQGEIPQLPAEYSETIFKLCREGITNALRHGHANKINIIIRYLIKNIELFVIDNGQGSQTIKKGFGLKGMESRTKAMNGHLFYGTLGGEGFCIHAEFPMTYDL